MGHQQQSAACSFKHAQTDLANVASEAGESRPLESTSPDDVFEDFFEARLRHAGMREQRKMILSATHPTFVGRALPAPTGSCLSSNDQLRPTLSAIRRFLQ
jgi:hypothetical protein